MNHLSSGGSLPAVIRNDAQLYEGNLIHYFQILFTEAQNLTHPYHNFKHMSHVTWLCHEACLYYRDVLRPREMRNLLVGALFHDFNHSGMMGDDDLNIIRAIRGLNAYLEPQDASEMPIIARIIRGTQFPHVISASDLDLCGLILRDADVSQALSVAWIQQVIFGLAAEWGKTPIEVLKMQEPFLSSLSFNTQWARDQFPYTNIVAKIEEAQDLLELLEMPDPA